MANRKGTKRTSTNASPIKKIEKNVKQAVAIDDEIQKVQQAQAKAEQIAQAQAKAQADEQAKQLALKEANRLKQQQVQRQIQNNDIQQSNINNATSQIQSHLNNATKNIAPSTPEYNSNYTIPKNEPTTFDMMSTTNMLNAMSDEEYAQYMAQNKPEVENFYNNVNEEATNKTDGKDLLTLLGETAANTGIGAVNTVKNIKNGVIDASTDIGHYDGTILDYIYMMNNPTAALMTVGSQALAQNNGVDVDANFNKQLAYNQQLAKDTDAPFDWATGKMANDWTNDETGQFWQSIGNNLVTAGVGLATGGLGFGTGAATAASLGAMGTGVYGGDTQQALDEGYNFKNASNYGLLDAGKEVGTELLSPGIPGLNNVNLLGEGAEEMLGAAVDPLVQLALQDDVSLGDVGNAALAGISPDNWGNIASAGAQGVLSALVLDGLTGGNSIKAIPSEIQNSIASDKATINNFINNDVYNQNVKAINDTIDMYQDVNTTEAKAMYQEALTQKLDIAKQYATAENLASNDKNIKIAAQRANADIIEQTAKQYNVNISEKSLNDIAKISNVLNTPMEFTDIALPENAEGMFDPTTNSIKIANKTTNPVLAVLGHETYHGIEETTSGQEYSQIVQQMADNGTLNTKNTLDIAKEVQEYYQTDDANTVNSETTAILTQKLLGNDKAIHQLALESSPSLIDNFKGLMNNIATKLTGTSATKQIAHAQDIFAKGVKEVANNQTLNTDSKNFADVVEEVANGEFNRETNNLIKVLTNTPTWAIDSGYKNLNILMTIKHLKSAIGINSTNGHNISKETFKNLPSLLNDPIAVIKQNENTDVAFLNDVDKDNLPIIAIIEKNSKGNYDNKKIDAHVILSTYGKNKITNYIIKNMTEDNIIYSKYENKNQILNVAKGLQLPNQNTNISGNSNISNNTKMSRGVSAETDNLRPDGSRKDLQAVHNISVDKLNKALELGGFPMPSIAVTKDTIGHEQFGDISLVFDKNSIDPANKNNKVYERDAWTSSYPNIEYKVNEKVANKVRNTISSILDRETENDLGYNSNDYYVDNLEYILNNGADINSIFNKDNAIKYAFLKDTGKDFELPYKKNAPHGNMVSSYEIDYIDKNTNISTKELETLANSKNDSEFEKVFNEYGNELLKAKYKYDVEHLAKNRVYADNNAKILNALENGKYKSSDLKNIYGESIVYKETVDIAKTLLKYNSSDYKGTIDNDKLESLFNETINENEYQNWLTDKFNGLIEDKGIYKPGVEKFRKDGSRKSFKQTHNAETLDNVVKSMKKTNLDASAEGRSVWSTKEILPQLAKNYDSIQSIIDDEGRLDNNKNTQYGEKFNAVSDEFNSYISDIVNSNDSSVNFRDVLDTMDLFLRKSKSPTDLMNKINNDGYAWKINEQQAENIFSMKQKMSELPTDYLEAKPERAVSFDEVKSAVLPNDSTYDEVASKLEEKGIDVKRYDPNIEGDRQAKIDERSDLKFSKGVSAETKKYSKYSNIELNKRVKNYKAIREDTMDSIFGRNEESFNNLINEATVEILENGDITPETKKIIIDKAISEGGTIETNDLADEVRSIMAGRVFKVEPSAYKDAGYDKSIELNSDFSKYAIRFSEKKGESLDEVFSELAGANLVDENINPREQIPYLKSIFENNNKLAKFTSEIPVEELTSYIEGSLNDFKDDVIEKTREDNKQGKKGIKNILSDDDIVQSENEERKNGNSITPEEYEEYRKDYEKWTKHKPTLDIKYVGQDISFPKYEARQSRNLIEDLAENGTDYTSLSKTVDQVGDIVAHGDKKLRKAWEDLISEPMYQATGGYSADVQADVDDIYRKLVKELGIKKGSKESQGLFWFSEKAKPTGNGGETTPYSLEDLKKDFPNSWENIVEGEKFVRNLYDDYYEKINSSLETIYPKKKLDELISKRKAELNEEIEKTNALLEKLQKENPQDKTSIDKYERQIKKYTRQYNKVESEILSNKRLPYRKDYMRHIQENVTAQSIIDILKGKTNINIDNNVAGVSDDTHPYTTWSSIMQRRNGGSYNDDAISSILSYVTEAEYKINIDPYTAYLRGVTQEYINASNEAEAHNGRTIRYLSNLANDLSRKTNPIDRVLVNTNNGRDILQLLKKVNSRIKANAVLGNINSAVSQFYNLPNAVAVMGDKGGAKSTVDWTKGLATMTQDMTKSYYDRAISMSPFMIQRYGIDEVMSKFDDKVIQTPRKMAKWLMTFGDKVVAQQTWYAAYEQGQRLNVDNPVFYADDITRRSVAGRGIGEVPLAQKSEIVKLVAPFQVEVNNQWQVLKHLATGGDKKKLLSGIMGMLAMATVSWLMNNVNESVTGRRVGFDPFDAILSARDENASISGRLVGNVLSNIPGGSYIRTAFGNDTAVSNWLGNEDPTRYGTGNMGIQAIAEPFIDMVTGTPYKASKLFNFALPFGGKQAERTYNYLADKGIAPDVTLFGSGLINADTKEGAYNTKGDRLKYTIDDDILNNIRGAMFGSSATTQGQDFSNAYDRGEVPTLGTNQTKYYEALGGGYDVYQAIQETRQTEKHVYNNGKTITNSKAAEVRKALEDAGLYDDVMEKINSGELPDDTLELNQTVEGWSQEEFNNFYDSLTDYEQGKTDTIETPKKYSASEQSTINTLSNYGISDDVASSIVKANDNYTKNVVNTDTGESIKNSKAALTRQQMIEDGSYQQVVDFLNSDENLNSDDPLKPSDFGLNKTVLNMSDEEYQELLKEINKYYSEDKKETGSINQDTDYTRFFDQFIA